jgi:hypothetical protein
MIKIISDNKKNKNPYSINTSQKLPIVFRVSTITEEYLTSKDFARKNIDADVKNIKA